MFKIFLLLMTLPALTALIAALSARLCFPIVAEGCYRLSRDELYMDSEDNPDAVYADILELPNWPELVWQMVFVNAVLLGSCLGLVAALVGSPLALLLFPVWGIMAGVIGAALFQLGLHVENNRVRTWARLAWSSLQPHLSARFSQAERLGERLTLLFVQ